MRLFIFTVCFLFQACAINIVDPVDFDPERPIVVEEQTIGRLFKQDGKLLNGFSIIDNFQERAETREYVEGYYGWLITGMTLGAVGGWHTGYGLGSGNYQRAIAGLAVASGGILLGSHLDHKTLEAVDVHNRSLNQQARGHSLPILRIKW